MKYQKIVGFDVSKEKLDLSEYDGERHELDQIDNDSKGIHDYFKKYEGNKEKILFVMEATGIYHIKLADILYEKGFNVAVVNPLRIKKYSEMRLDRAKTDKTDCRTIAMYGYNFDPDLYTKTQKNRRRLVKLMKSVNNLEQTRNSYLNRLESINHDSIVYDKISSEFEEIIQKIEDSINELEAEARSIIESNYSRTREQLLNIRGVGEVLSTAVIGYFGRFENFDNAKQPPAYVGINPNPRQSGKSVNGRGSISKKGVKYLRTKLYMASLSAGRFNPSCRRLKERMKKKGKENNVIRIAVANKLLRQIFAVLKYDREWKPNYEKRFKS